MPGMNGPANARNANGSLALAAIGALLLIGLPAAIVLSGSFHRRSPKPPAAVQVGGFVISDVRVSDVKEDSAVVTWRTSEPADSQVLFGEGDGRDRATPRQPDLALEHKVPISNLNPGTTYGVTLVSSGKGGLIFSAAGPGFRTQGFSKLADLCKLPRGGVFANLPPMGTGVSWVDFNNDGRLDVFVASEGLSGSRLFRNAGNGFQDATSLSSSAFGGRGRQSAWADYNGDGFPDLLLTSGRGAGLFTNNGPPNFTFRDSTSLLPEQRFYDTEGAGWIDYNNDGKVDLLVTNGKYGILVFENTCAPGSPNPAPFRDVSAQVGLGPNGFGAGFGDYVTLGDYNGDGRTDFLYNLYTGILARNAGARFERADNAGVNYLSTSTRKLGAVFGDYDNDGNVDIFVPQRGPSKLYHNKGDGTFADVAKQAGLLASPDMDAVSAAWGDINNDGLLDLFIGCESGDRTRGNRLLMNNGNGAFRDVTEKFGVGGEGHRARGVTFVDYDGDGDLDLYVHNYSAPDCFYENNLITEDNHNYVEVKFSPKRCPIGAVVRLFSAEGKLRGMREISGGQGLGSQDAPIAHFGAAPGQYKIAVRYTNGATAEKQITVDPKGRNVVTFE